MTTQIAVKLSDETVAAVDQLVNAGRFSSRSHAVRAGLDLLVQTSRDETIDRAFAAGFSRMPDSAEELRDAKRLAIDAIEDEPWDKWW